MIALPEVTEYVLAPEDEFLILASDGVWEFIDNQEASARSSRCTFFWPAGGCPLCAAFARFFPLLWLLRRYFYHVAFPFGAAAVAVCASIASAGVVVTPSPSGRESSRMYMYEGKHLCNACTTCVAFRRSSEDLGKRGDEAVLRMCRHLRQSP